MRSRTRFAVRANGGGQLGIAYPVPAKQALDSEAVIDSRTIFCLHLRASVARYKSVLVMAVLISLPLPGQVGL